MQPSDYAFDQLMAQRDAAYWAGVSAVVAALALFVSMLGIALIWIQIRANRAAILAASASADAAATAARLASAEVRPWMELKAELDWFPSEPAPMCTVHISATNVGRLPAVDARLDLLDIDEATVWLDRMEKGVETISNASRPVFPGGSIHEKVDYRVDVHEGLLRTYRVGPLLAVVEYMLPGETRMRWTAAWYVVSSFDGLHGKLLKKRASSDFPLVT